jgi:hypothetical protein
MSTDLFGLLSTSSVQKRPDSQGGGFRLERRKRVRTRVHWRVLFFREGAAEAVESLTQNLSSSGFYCLSQAPFACGDLLICVLGVPTHDPPGSGRTLELECRVRVVRSEPLGEDGIVGIACRIEDYRFPALDQHSSTAQAEAR